MITPDEYFNEVKDCDYKGEHYSVRDNGAIMRHPKSNKARPKDNLWTFGSPNDKGYCAFCGEVVHRIVAFAFLGEPENNQLVVDHIDTNRQNNRPENLRWVTKLENALNTITIGPVKKGFRASIQYNEGGTCQIEVSKNNGPFALKAEGKNSASYTIDF